jgi:hypothetical protein
MLAALIALIRNMPLKRKILFHFLPRSFSASVPSLAQNSSKWKFYLSPAPHALPHAAGVSAGLSEAPHALPHAAGVSAGLSEAPHALPHAAGVSAGLSEAPHALPHAAAGVVSVFFFHPNKLESAIIIYLLFSLPGALTPLPIAVSL